MSNYVIENTNEAAQALSNALEYLKEIYQKDDIFRLMELHSALGVELYKKAVSLSLLNEQEFMNWQDELNAISYVQEEDL